VALLAVDGLGPKTLKLLWEGLRIRTLEELERALHEGRVQTLTGFGVRREARLREAVRIQRRGNERVPCEKALRIANRILESLAEHPRVEACSVAGSLRRGLSTVGDIDLVAASDDPASVADVLLEQPDVEYVYSRGPHRVGVRVNPGVDVDLRIVPAVSFGSALLYFTGNRAHTLALRRLALAQGLRLNEYGLFRKRRRIAGETEREIYEALSLAYIAPEQRRGEAEIRDALRKAKPGTDVGICSGR
jgi:DNA polymerase (family 10)